MSVSTSSARAGGIDLGGTKIESTVFDGAMVAITSRRRPTPRGTYAELLAALEAEVNWLRDTANAPDLPVGCPCRWHRGFRQ